MHSRYRGPGNGYRSNSMGMPFSGSRMSQGQDTSGGRGRGFYNSEYRPFNNRGFSRGQGRPKSFQQPPPQPQPPPTKADIFMEAGRLATEYLVSKRVLPPSALTSKWQNGSYKKQGGDHQDFRQQEELLQDGRTSAHARLGSSLSDAAIGRRRYPDEVNSRNHAKGRRRGEYYRSNSSDWGREYGRSSSWSDRSGFSPDMDSEDNNNGSGAGFPEEQQVGNSDVDSLREPAPCGLVPTSEGAASVEVEQEKRSNSDELGSKASSSNAVKDDEWEPSKGSDHVTNCKLGKEEMRESISEYRNEEHTTPESLSNQHCNVEDDLMTKNGSDLLSLCMFAKIPTKTRSALTSRVPKVDLVDNNEEGNPSNIGLPKRAEALVQDASHDVSTGDAMENANQDSAYPVFGLSNLMPGQAAQNDGALATTFGARQGKSLRSQSFPDRDFVHDIEQEANLGLSSLVRSSSVKERGEKRAVEDGEMNEAIKKPREWFQSLVGDKDLHLSNLNRNKVGLQGERASSSEQICPAVNGHSLGNNSPFANSGETCINYAQEKKLFPSSFKICDLNLMEASDVSDSHHSEPVLMYPSLVGTEKSSAQVDVDLSISNSTMSGEYARCMNDCKEIEVIDLENDSASEESAFNNSHIKMETSFASTGGFPSHTQNASEMPDVQDLMMSELFNNFSSCTPVPDDINRLQNDVGLQNGEGTLGDDDSIYMSLGEIPLSFIPAWQERTPQEYDKPF